MSDRKSVAGQWGPIAFALSPDVSLDDLESAAGDLFHLFRTVTEAASEKFEQYRSARDPELKRTLWAECQEFRDESEVLYSWYRIVSAVSTFAQLGCQSPYMGGVADVEIIDIPQSYQG